MNIIIKAAVFAEAAHSAINQRRKYTDDPYINHPIAVSKMLFDLNHPYSTVAAAMLHDVIEDTQVKLSVIERHFGKSVASLVDWVTDISKPSDGNRAKRKAIDRERLANAPEQAQSIKVADLIDNTSTIVVYDPDFAKVYLAEKRLLLDVLTKADPRLLERADAQLKAHGY